MSEETEEGLEGYASEYEATAAQQAAGAKTRLRIISWMLGEGKRPPENGGFRKKQ